ncbi:hypothetical protein [Nocardia arthritidis]|uniref:Uncharacterized protein n=1 Tax=Nocardia arthritidis TaxID=228602 RepID=A0A6G9YT39_9NOCA|nr:hypothetical protein [Nocardia arthritidis]QIS16310.1 hypothetical protein F5544_42505 [Nocardia arthritidis]
MSRASRYLSESQLRATFDRELSRALRGEGARNHSGLDFDTYRALARVAGAYPNIPPELIEAARTAFSGQLDGSNRAARPKLSFEPGELNS